MHTVARLRTCIFHDDVVVWCCKMMMIDDGDDDDIESMKTNPFPCHSPVECFLRLKNASVPSHGDERRLVAKWIDYRHFYGMVWVFGTF